MIREKSWVENVRDMATVPQINLLLFCFESTLYIIYFNNMQNCIKETNTIEIRYFRYFYFQAKPSLILAEMNRNIYKNVSKTY